MQSTMVRCDIRATYTVRRTVFLVHSAGGAAVEGLLNGACATVSKPATEPIEDEELGLRLSCEQARAVPKGVKVLGVVSYEGYVRHELEPGAREHAREVRRSFLTYAFGQFSPSSHFPSDTTWERRYWCARACDTWR